MGPIELSGILPVRVVHVPADHLSSSVFRTSLPIMSGKQSLLRMKRPVIFRPVPAMRWLEYTNHEVDTVPVVVSYPSLFSGQ